MNKHKPKIEDVLKILKVLEERYSLTTIFAQITLNGTSYRVTADGTNDDLYHCYSLDGVTYLSSDETLSTGTFEFWGYHVLGDDGSTDFRADTIGELFVILQTLRNSIWDAITRAISIESEMCLISDCNNIENVRKKLNTLQTIHENGNPEITLILKIDGKDTYVNWDTFSEKFETRYSNPGELQKTETYETFPNSAIFECWEYRDRNSSMRFQSPTLCGLQGGIESWCYQSVKQLENIQNTITKKEWEE